MQFPNQFPRRGEIYYVKDCCGATGSEMWANRHAVVISNDKLNKNSGVVMIAFITTKNKSASRFHIDVSTKNTHRVVLCEQIVTVDKSRLVEYKGYLAKHHLDSINHAIGYTLGAACPA